MCIGLVRNTSSKGRFDSSKGNFDPSKGSFGSSKGSFDSSKGRFESVGMGFLESGNFSGRKKKSRTHQEASAAVSILSYRTTRKITHLLGTNFAGNFEPFFSTYGESERQHRELLFVYYGNISTTSFRERGLCPPLIRHYGLAEGHYCCDRRP